MSAFGGKADMPLSAAPRSVSSYIFALTIELHSNMQVEFVTIDVFTDRQFGGNPLAVVADGTELSSRQMQAIAAEFNLAETTFVLPPERPENTAKGVYSRRARSCRLRVTPISAPYLCWGNAASATVGRSMATLCNLKKSRSNYTKLPGPIRISRFVMFPDARNVPLRCGLFAAQALYDDPIVRVHTRQRNGLS
jgi:hypothetical protein